MKRTLGVWSSLNSGALLVALIAGMIVMTTQPVSAHSRLTPLVSDCGAVKFTYTPLGKPSTVSLRNNPDTTLTVTIFEKIFNGQSCHRYHVESIVCTDTTNIGAHTDVATLYNSATGANLGTRTVSYGTLGKNTCDYTATSPESPVLNPGTPLYGYGSVTNAGTTTSTTTGTFNSH